MGNLGGFVTNKGQPAGSGLWQYGLNLWSTSTLQPGQSATFGVDNVTNLDISAQSIGDGTYTGSLQIVDASPAVTYVYNPVTGNYDPVYGPSDLLPAGTVLATVHEAVIIK
jgi:hypothetical protein